LSLSNNRAGPEVNLNAKNSGWLSNQPTDQIRAANRGIIQHPVKQLLCTLPIIAAALGPISASAAPNPSPSLGTLLAAPPTGYTQLTTGTFHGRFSAADYATTDPSKALEAGIKLIQDGFVDGYGMTWVQRSSGHLLIEFVIAFEGGKGARSWLGYEEASDKSNPYYKHSDTLSGIDPYYGVHLVLTSPRAVSDAFSFVKGNDLFGVGFASAKDDVLKLATSQTRSQYAAAPDQTIPKAQWPENPSSRGPVYIVGGVLGAVVVLVLIAGVVRLVVGRLRGS
jgi:hypothetical protein